MNILVDTSVWIEYFRGKPGYFSLCQGLLEKSQIKTLEVIFGELLQGALNKKESEILQSYYEYLPKINIADLAIFAGEYSRQHKLIGKGIGLIDSIIIVAALETNCKLWTLDKKLQNFIPDKFRFIPVF